MSGDEKTRRSLRELVEMFVPEHVTCLPGVSELEHRRAQVCSLVLFVRSQAIEDAAKMREGWPKTHYDPNMCNSDLFQICEDGREQGREQAAESIRKHLLPPSLDAVPGSEDA